MVTRRRHGDAAARAAATARGARPHAGALLPASPLRGVLAALVAAAIGLVAGCSDAPPPIVGQAPQAAPAPVPQFEPDPTQLRIGVDDLGVGFNPHRLSDLTPMSRAAASLVLPSTFRIGPDGSRRLDPAVVTSARVSATAPFTVSYEIAPAATWSDNAPIAAEDFVYLWEQMRSQPAVAGASGYRAVTDVRSRAGGKAVDVVFDRPYPAWATLFDNLLPAHLLKDAPGSWGGALQDSIPVSGGPYAVRSVDRIRGIVTLARNDRFWGTPAVSDQVVFQAADRRSLIDRVATGDVQATQFRADGEDLAALAPAANRLSVQRVPEPQVVSLSLRSDAGPLADVRARRAVVAALDRSALVESGAAGGPAASLPADAFALAPSQPGYRPSLPPDSPAAHPDPAAVRQDLAAAGYTRDAGGYWARDGQRLRLRLAAPPQASPYGRLLPTVAAELRAAGIDTVVVADSGANPFPAGRGPLPSTAPEPTAPSTASSTTPGTTTPGTTTPGTTTPGATTPGSTTPTPGSSTATSGASTTTSVPPLPKSPSDMAVADVSVLALPVGGDPVADLDSRVGCPGRRAPQTSGSTPVPASSTTPAATTAPAGPSATRGPAPASSSSAPPSSSAAETASPSGSTSGSGGTSSDPLATPRASEAVSPSGFCDPALQSVLDGASSGVVSRDTALALGESQLWEQVPEVPLFQAESVLVAPLNRTDVTVGPLGASPLAGADRWSPPPRLARANGDSNH